MPQILTTVDDLAEAMLSERPPAILDVRWKLGDPDGRAHYRDGHILGAVFVDLDTELADPPSPERGRHPLPAVDRLQEAARGWGLDDGAPVVVYDDDGNRAAARAWWLLRWAGVREVALLDGGLEAWRAAGMRLSTGDTAPRRGDVTLAAGSMPTAGIDEVAETDSVLLDARPPERYRGGEDPIDPRAGHIPGAHSMPTGGNLDADGRFLSETQLRERFATVGVAEGSDVIAYCGSGVTAAHQIVALGLAGVDATLFPGSWSQWSSDPSRPAATGSTP